MKARPAAAIEVRGLRKQFGSQGVLAIEEVSLSIRPGEFVSVLGPSGCGKSTLLRCIAGLESPSGGSVSVNGATVDGPPEGLGMVFQRDALLDWRNVADNLMLPVDFRRGDRAAARERAAGLLALTGLQGFEKAYPAQLSGGMRQRVGLARALTVDADIILMDEPFSSVDEQTRRKFQEDLLDLLRHHQKTVIFVTHSIEEAAYLSDQIALLSPRPGTVSRIVKPEVDRRKSPDEIRRDRNYLDTVDEIWGMLRQYV